MILSSEVTVVALGLVRICFD